MLVENVLCTEKVSEMFGDARESGEQTEVRNGRWGEVWGWSGEERVFRIRNS